MPTDSLSAWLKSGEVISIGGRDFRLMPIPLRRLQRVVESLHLSIVAKLRDIFNDEATLKNPLAMVVDIINSLDAVDICYHLFADPKDPEGNPVNAEATKEFFEQYLDTPSLNKIIESFIKVNELQETIKNLQSLPGINQLLKALTTFGQMSLSSLQRNMGSDLARPEILLSPKLDSTLRDGITERLESGEPTSVQ